MKIERLSESAVMVHLGEVISTALLKEVGHLYTYLEEHYSETCADLVPSYTGVTLYFKSCIDSYVMDSLLASCEGYKSKMLVDEETKVHSIVVEYTGEDLGYVAEACGLKISEVIALHSQPIYTVGMMGFTPGFPYLVGLPEELHLPRRSTPRKSVAAGAVAIGGAQAGIYPHSSPGGWHILGYTEVKLFDIELDPPVLLKPGDKVKFIVQ
jgi:KipI family sensor histidine kinase inhibitor